MADTGKKDSLRMFFVWLAFMGGIIAPLWFVAAPLGTKLGLWNWQFGLGQMTFAWGPKVLIGAGVLAVLGLILALLKAPRFKPFLLSLFPLITIGIFLALMLPTVQKGRALPPIHDVQTDWTDPVTFSDTIMTSRGKDANPVLEAPVIPEGAKERWPAYAGMSVAEAQRQAYQDIKSYISTAPTDILYAAALATMAEQGIEIVVNDEAALRIEGTYTSFWYDFKDDVVVRVQAKGEGSQIDIRSTSRVGLSDLGANAERVRAILEGIKERLQLAET